MKIEINKKIILLGIILVILAGIIVVTLKGVNVSLLFQQHESVSMLIGKSINYDDINNICKDVFGNKEYVLRNVELFNDSINISVESITNDEKNQLIEKVNEKYGTTFTEDNVSIVSLSNVRVRDFVKVYIVPTLITVLIIAVYMIIRFRKINIFKLFAKLIEVIVLSEAVIFSLVAIFRVPLSPVVINIMAVIAMVEVMVYIESIAKRNAVIEAKEQN